MARRWHGGLLIAAAVGALSADGCAHGRARVEDPTPAAQACAGVAPLSVLVGPTVPATAVARGQALYCLALYEPALSVLTDQAIRKPVKVAIDDAIASPASPAPPPLAADRLAALRWLVYIHRRFPAWERVNVAVGEVARADLERPELADVRDDLHAIAARFEYERGEFDKALALLRLIPASSALHVHALLLEGAIHVRCTATEPAVTAFSEAQRIAPAGPERDLAVISLARLYYAMGWFEPAARNYNLLPPPSPHWPRAALEGAWASFQLKDYPRARAQIQTLAARPGEVPAETMAEALTVAGAVAVYTCRRTDFQNAIEPFNATYPVLFMEAKKRLREAPDALADQAFRIRAGGAQPSPSDALVIPQLLKDTQVVRHLDEVDELERERIVYDRLDAGWRVSSQGVDVGGALALRRAAVRRETSELLRRRLQRLADELGTQIKNALKVEAESYRWASPVPSDLDEWDLCQQEK